MILIYFLGCLFFIFLQGFFAGSEIAFISSSMLRLRHRQKKDKRARIAYELLSNPERFFATALVGTNISVIVSSTLATYFLIDMGLRNSNIWITFLFTPLVVIFAELVPKNIGRYYKEEFSIKVGKLFKTFETIFYPLVFGIEKVSGFLIKLFLGKVKKRSFAVTREEIKALVAEVEKEGVLEKGEKEAIEDIFDFGETKLKDVCISLGRLAAVDYADTPENIFDRARKQGFTRYPVFRNKEIKGYINIFDFFYKENKDWHSLIRPITFLGSSQKLYEAFSLLKRKKESIAAVMKGRRILGIVTLEDLIREILTSIVK